MLSGLGYERRPTKNRCLSSPAVLRDTCDKRVKLEGKRLNQRSERKHNSVITGDFFEAVCSKTNFGQLQRLYCCAYYSFLTSFSFDCSYDVRLPVHILPSPANPGLQRQLYEPNESVQSAPRWQECMPKIHSLASVKKGIPGEVWVSVAALTAKNGS